MQPLRRYRVTLAVRFTTIHDLTSGGRGGGEADGRVGHRLRVDAPRDGGGLGVEHCKASGARLASHISHGQFALVPNRWG